MAARNWLGHNWRETVLQLFGVVHILYSGLGFSLVLDTIFPVSWWASGRLDDAEGPFTTDAFLVMTGINFSFLIILVFAGIWLLITKRQTLGVKTSNRLFVSIIVYEIGISFIWTLGGSAEAFSHSVAGATGIGNMGIAPVVLTGYPIVALIALNLIHRKIPKLQTSEHSPT